MRPADEVLPKIAHRQVRVRYDGRRLAAREAQRVFVARTGRAPADADLVLLVAALASALDASQRDRDVPCDRARGRGRPRGDERVSSAVCALLDVLHPADAALLVLLYGLDASVAFPVARAPRNSDVIEEGYDAQRLLRRVEQRLRQIRRANSSRAPASRATDLPPPQHAAPGRRSTRSR